MGVSGSDGRASLLCVASTYEHHGRGPPGTVDGHYRGNRQKQPQCDPGTRCSPVRLGPGGKSWARVVSSAISTGWFPTCPAHPMQWRPTAACAQHVCGVAPQSLHDIGVPGLGRRRSGGWCAARSSRCVRSRPGPTASRYHDAVETGQSAACRWAASRGVARGAPRSAGSAG
jgi:hypothetical protein